MPETPFEPQKLVVVGQGYVGLPLAVRAVEQGFDVIGFDVDSGKIKQLEAGESTVEDVGDERLRAALATGRYRPTTSAEDCVDFDVAVISVPTPLRDGNPDLSFIEQAAQALVPHLTKGATVVLESTTYPGTTEELVGPILEDGAGLLAGRDFHLGYSPERIDPGNPQWTLENTPKVVSGIDPVSLAAVQSFYDRIVETTVAVSTPKEAELTKLLENTFRHVNIALVNELAVFAHELGVDLGAAIEAASTKPFGFMPFLPGPGVGGHCLPVDPSYLSWRVQRDLRTPFRFVELANEVNARMPNHVVQRVQGLLNHDGLALRGSRVLVLGLAYKPRTGDVREAPSTVITASLRRLGAEVVAVDPYVDTAVVDPGVPLVALDAEQLRAADVVLVLTDHPDFDVDLVAGTARRVLDTRRCIPTGGTALVERL